MREKIMVRQAQSSDINGIINVEKATWPDGLRAERDKWEARIKTFPEGTIVGIVNGQICGVMSTEIVDYDYKHKDASWYEITDNGYIKGTHKPNGKYLYGVDLSVCSNLGHSFENRISRELILAVANLIIDKELKGALLGGRIPKFYEYASQMSVEQYVYGPWGLDGKNRDKPYDPELYFYLSNGLEVIRIIPDYINDSDSLNHGVLLRWRNPFHPDTSRSEGEIALSKITETFSSVDEVFDPETHATISRWVLLLPGAGCQWAKKSGGCYMCGFKYSTQKYTRGKLLPPWLFEVFYKLGHKKAIRKNPSVLAIYNGGSFICDAEIPKHVQEFICRKVSSDPTIRKLFVESRSEFVTGDKVSRLVDLMKGKQLELGIGLECVTDYIREHSIHKGMTLESYEEAIHIAKAHGVRVLTYVFLKPLFLNEGQAIEEAIKTIEYAFKVGSDTVALESAFVQPGTVMEEHFNKGEFVPPKLWSVIEVAERTKDMGPVLIGGFIDEPMPIAIPHNCSKCSGRIYPALDKYRKTLDTSILNNIEDCECKQEWERDLHTKSQ